MYHQSGWQELRGYSAIEMLRGDTTGNLCLVHACIRAPAETRHDTMQTHDGGRPTFFVGAPVDAHGAGQKHRD